jgi:pimeloyl-ACP methyl ester carboxylesterase
MPTFYFLEGNSCIGSTRRIERLEAERGNRIISSRYFGRVFTKEGFLGFTLNELRENNVTECIIIGSSFGGHLSIHLVKHLFDHPEIGITVQGLVLTGTPPIGGPDDFPQAFRAPVELVEPGGRAVLELLASPSVLTAAESERFLRPAFGWIDHFPSEEDQQLFYENQEELMTNLDMGQTRHDILTKLTTFGNEIEIIKRLLQTGLRLLIIHAELDPVISLNYIWSAIPQIEAGSNGWSRIVLVTKAPHYCHWSHPDEFMNLIHQNFN